MEIANSVMSFNQLVSHAKRNENLKFINMSSQEVYGNVIGGRMVDYSVKPISIYGFAKLLTEMQLSETRQESNWNFTSIRLAGVVSDETNDRMINRMVLSAIRDGSIVVNGAEKRFSFIEVRDVAKAIVSMVYSNLRWADIYNLNNGPGKTLLEIAQVIKSEVNREIGKDVSIIVNKNAELFDASMDNSSFCADFFWSAKFRLMEVVQSIIQKNK
ncbi:NAD dependent epimerase/dehydratase family protein [compost metagenome]